MPTEIVAPDPLVGRAAGPEASREGAGEAPDHGTAPALGTPHDADGASAPPVVIDVHGEPAGEANASGDGPFALNAAPGPPLVLEIDAPASRRAQLVEGLLALAGHAAALTALLSLGEPLPPAPDAIEVTVVVAGDLSPVMSPAAPAAETEGEAAASPEQPSPTQDAEAHAPPPPPEPGPETAAPLPEAQETPQVPPPEKPAPPEAPPTSASEQRPAHLPEPAPPEAQETAPLPRPVTEAQDAPPLPPPPEPAHSQTPSPAAPDARAPPPPASALARLVNPPPIVERQIETLPPLPPPRVEAPRRPKPAVPHESATRLKRQKPPSKTGEGRNSAAAARLGSSELRRAGAPEGQAVAAGTSRASYAALVVAEIQAHRFYPGSARARGEQGAVGVVFTIGSNGRVASAEVVRPSGFAELDAAARQIVRSIAPPPPPGGSFSASTTIRFRFE